MESIIGFLKNLTIGKKIFLLISPLIAMLVSVKTMLIGLLFLIFIDLLTGIRKTLYKRGVPFNIFKKVFWMSIKSYLLRQTWRKTYEYGFGIIAISVIESMIVGTTVINILDKSFTLTEIAIVFPAGVEVWSIYENFEEVSGHNVLDKIKKILPQTLQSIFSSDKVNKNNKNG